MGHRLSKIYTRTGDEGDTGLANGDRISKTDLRIELLGSLDELNSALGLLIAQSPTKTTHNIPAILLSIQHDLFDIGGELSLPGELLISNQRVTRLEQQLDLLNEDLPWLKEFILPGGNIPAATCHLARSISRRTERVIVALSETQSVNPATLAYLNRLSDLLFVVARCLARAEGGQEIFWQKNLANQDE